VEIVGGDCWWRFGGSFECLNKMTLELNKIYCVQWLPVESVGGVFGGSFGFRLPGS